MTTMISVRRSDKAEQATLFPRRRHYGNMLYLLRERQRSFPHAWGCKENTWNSCRG